MIPLSDIKNEFGTPIALTVLCCRVYFKTADIDELNNFIANADVDWEEVLHTCRQHKVRPLVYRILLKANLPEVVRQKINLELRLLSVESIKQAVETERLICLFNKKGIKVIPYKGTAFSKQFFGHISMRESSDIDLVIRAEDLPKTFQIMEEEGFESPLKEHYNYIGHNTFIEREKDFYFDKFLGNKREFHVELHFNIIMKGIYIPNNLNNFKIHPTDTNKLVQENIQLLDPAEHFKAVILHHMLQDRMGYLKTVIDLTQAMNVLATRETFNDDVSYTESIMNELSTSFNIDIVKIILNDIIGTSFITNNKQTKKTALFTNKILAGDYKKIRENNFPIWNAIKHNYLTYNTTSSFYVTNNNKYLYFSKSFQNIIRPHLEDINVVKLDKAFYFLYYIIRPFRLLLLPTDPNKSKNKSQ
jgi:hypothetical protein